MPPHVAVLLCTFNGQSFLAAQLDSLKAQTFRNWRAWVSDDGSTDGTLDILRRYQHQWGNKRLTILQGPMRGPAANFMSLVHNGQISADYFAYCDQDDIWEPDKLLRATQALSRAQAESGADRPLLYGTRARYIDEGGRELGVSSLFVRPPTFANALVQCIAGGNTMVFNRAARALLDHVPASQDITMHDWLTYIAVTACGGRVLYDPYLSVRYRQHAANERGMNISILARLQRMRGLLDGRYRAWNHLNIAALHYLAPWLTPKAQQQLAQFITARDGHVAARVLAFFRSGVYRQSTLDNAALAAMAIVRRL